MVWRLAIDFGTSTTAAAVVDDGGVVRLLNVDPNVGDGPMASAVAVQPDGSWLVGTAAVRSAAVLADAYEPSPKRRIGEQVVRLGGRDFAPSDLVAAVLGEVLFEAYRQHGGSAPAEVILTHPARWRAGRLKILRDAYGKAVTSLPRRFASAGLDGAAAAHHTPAPTFLAEPVAAARYLLDKDAPAANPALVAVYDLGAGTFDTSVVRRDAKGRFEVLAEGGIVDLGGVVFDEKLLAFIGKSRIAAEDPAAWEQLVNPGQDPVWLRRARALLEEARYAKERLSTHMSAHCAIPELHHLAAVLITRGDFEDLIRDDLQAASHEFARTVALAGASLSDLAGVHLVGGSARIPLAASMLLGELGVAAMAGMGDPRETVVRGALISPPAAPKPQLPQGKSLLATFTGRVWDGEQRLAGASAVLAVTEDALLVGAGASVQRHRLAALTAPMAQSLGSEDVVAIVGGYQQLGGHLLEFRGASEAPLLTVWCPDDSPSRTALAEMRVAFERARLGREVAKSTRKNGPGHAHTLGARFQLARAVGELGRHEDAVTMLAELVADGGRLSGPDHPDTMTARSLLASQLNRSGRLDDAAGEYTSLLVAQTRVLGADHPQTLVARNNRAHVLLRLGRAQESLEEFSVLVAARTAASGADHPETLTARNNYAFALGEVERFGEAVDEYARLIDDYRRLSGDEHPSTFNARANRASLLGKCGEAERGRQEYATLIADRTRVWGADQPATMAVRQSYAQLLQQAGRSQEAVDALAQLAADFTRIFGAEDASTLTVRLLRARALLDRCLHREALLELTDLVGTLTRARGGEAPATLTARLLRANALAELSRVPQALDELAEVVAVHRRVSGESHRGTLVARTHLAERLIQIGRVAEAEAELSAVIESSMDQLGAHHQTTLAAQRFHARALALIGDAEAAIDEAAALIATRTAAFGAEHVGTLQARAELASCLGAAGRLEQALEADGELLTDRRRILGRNHPDTLATRAQIARWLLRLGRSEEAADALVPLVADSTRVFGSDHARTSAAVGALATARNGSGETEMLQ